MDVVYVTVSVLFFALMAGVAMGCAKLGGRK
jgi:hypothetical protein